MTIPGMVRRIGLAAVVLLSAAPAQAQDTREVRGVIDQDQTWAGPVQITADTTIQGAVVTVSPGAVIEFAPATPGQSLTLTLGSMEKLGARLLLKGSAEHPITIRTRKGATPGRLVLNLQSRMPPAVEGAEGEDEKPPGARIADDMTVQHVVFEDLGPKRVRPKTQQEAELVYYEPGVFVNASGMAHALTITDCAFKNSARLQINAGDGSRITLTGNRFADCPDRTAVEVFGRHGQAPSGQIAASHNRLDASIRILGAPALVLDNILIGGEACIVAEATDSPDMKIRGNFVHNTTKNDDGHYCLNCDDANAVIEDNILIGGTTVVLRGSRRMTGNVLIGAAPLKSKLVKNARTHQLVQSLPAGAVFERNLLLGPAYSLLCPQPSIGMTAAPGSSDSTLIRHNVFDGLDNSNKAVHLNHLGATPARVEILNNLFLRLTTLVFDETEKGSDALAYLDYNAAAPRAEKPFVQVKIGDLKRGSPGWASKDVNADSIDALRLIAGSAKLPDDCDERIESGRLSAGELRRALFEAYRPRSGSPLVGAGKGESSGMASPAIGALEPVEKP